VKSSSKDIAFNSLMRINGSSVLCRCGAQQGGDLGSTNQALDGIVGFGESNTSMLSQLAAAGEVKKIFSHCLDTISGGGIFAIGDVVQPKVKTTPLIPNMYVRYIIISLFYIRRNLICFWSYIDTPV
jgi:hypothetical protein